MSSFSGLAALPVLRDDFVVQRRLVTDRDLNTSVVIGRITPGPKGLYIVSLGYYAGGFPGAAAAWLALITPALLVIPLLAFASRRAREPRVRQVLNTLVLASAGVSLSATFPLALDAVRGPWTLAIAVLSLVVLVIAEAGTIWVVAGGATTCLLLFWTRVATF